MAINPQGQVTTTGLMNQGAAKLQVPDMSGMVPREQPIQPKRTSQPVRTANITPDVQTDSNQIDIVQRLNSLTADDMAILNPALPPSVKQVLAKIIPEISSLLEKVGTDEESVPVKFSVMASLPENIQNFILESNNPQQMDNTNVPLDRQTDQAPSGMMARNEPPLPEQDDSGVDVSQDLV